jgi:hypothetical protein
MEYPVETAYHCLGYDLSGDCNSPARVTWYGFNKVSTPGPYPTVRGLMTQGPHMTGWTGLP